ncbi:MAG TPA: Mrp/NBP35 family ATP-binding protein [Planctomycetaceae bacterium]|nr:Mrp/NBP35 family ATP-binding protein [Planctomycetaceae bacterium]
MTDARLNEADVLRSLHDVTDPEVGRPLSSLNMLKGARVTDGTVEVHVELPTPAYPDRGRIGDAVTAALKSRLPQAGTVKVTFSSNVRGKNSGGAIGLRVKNVIAVGSGKGGVGKSTIAAALAFGLKHYGARVGLMDADVYGPSIPHLLGVSGRPEMVEPQPGLMRIIPIEHDGLKVLSIGFIVEPEQAVVWRGPMLHKLLTQFLKDTEWGDLDYLIIDLPPGTGDVALTLSQLLGLAGAVVVCTPQQVALLDAVKAISMFNQVKIPVLGIVENMSGEIFGRGGAQAKAAQLGIPFLGEVPIEAGIRVKGDAGRICELFSTENPSRQPLLGVTERVAVEVAKSLLSTPTLPTLEIL